MDYFINPNRRYDLDRVFDNNDGPLERIIVVDYDCDVGLRQRRGLKLGPQFRELCKQFFYGGISPAGPARARNVWDWYGRLLAPTTAIAPAFAVLFCAYRRRIGR